MALPLLEKFNDWQVRDVQAGKQLSFHLYNGIVSVQVRDIKNHNPKPIYSHKIGSYHMQFVKRAIDSILKASPETKFPVKFSDMDPNNKGQTFLSLVMTFEKDSKQCIKIHLTDVRSNQTFSFLVRGNGLISVGADPISDGDRSSAMMHDLKDWINNAYIWGPATLTGQNSWNKNGPQRGNGGGGYRGGNGGGGGWNGGGNGGGGSSSPDVGGGDDGGLPF